jgi:hypothetical protein
VGDLDRAVSLALRLLADTGLYRHISAAAVERARRFRHEDVIPRYEELYQRLLSESTPSTTARSTCVN